MILDERTLPIYIQKDIEKLKKQYKIYQADPKDVCKEFDYTCQIEELKGSIIQLDGVLTF